MTIESPAPIVVAGMHRSGTSFAASLVEAIGLNMGNTLAGDDYNPPGYFEDVEILRFHQHMFAAITPSDVAGFPDWGWTTAGGFESAKLASFRESAADLVRRRRESGHGWGWKDPRTTILLDFWHSIAPEARFLCVYRAPWDVADSIFRVGTPHFIQHPHHALLVWEFYNRRMLDFFRAHRDRCVLANIQSVVTQPSQLATLMTQRLGSAHAGEKLPSIVEAKFSSEIFHERPADDAFVQLCLSTPSPILDTWQQLEAESDMPGMPLLYSKERSPGEHAAALVAPLLAASSLLKHTQRELDAMRNTRLWRLRTTLRRLLGLK